MRLAPAGLAAFALLAVVVQDPTPDQRTAPEQDPARVAHAPVGADPLPPVLDPPTSAVERRDLLAAFVPATGYEGFYRLTGVAVGGAVLGGPGAVDMVRGYLAIGRQHLAIHVLQRGAPGQAPMVQAGFRRYRVDNGVLITTSLVGHDNLGDDQLRFEAIGLEERRELVRTPTTLRVMRGPGAWMEFVRVE